jgi:type I restriction enzyme R subunit
VDHLGGEAVLEEALLAWLRDLGYHTVEGGEIAPDSKAPERADFREVLLVGRLRAALQRINPTLSGAANDEAMRILRRADSPSALLNNRRFHRHLMDGVAVEVSENGQIRGRTVRLIDCEQPERNAWLAVNQFTLARASQLVRSSPRTPWRG